MMEIEVDDCFEYAVLFSLLSRKPVKFINSECIDDNVEILKYFQILSPALQYDVRGNSIEIEPGFLIGGKIVGNACSIPSCVKLLLTISPFIAENLELELSGITNHGQQSIDIFKVSFFKIFRIFQLPSFDLSIIRRGFSPEGGGIITLKTKTIRSIDAISYSSRESLSKIRGFVITSRIGSDIAHRMIHTIKNDLSSLGNTKVLCIVNNRNDSGPSPGYECSVLAESDNGVFYQTLNNKEIPEKMAGNCCKKLLRNILKGGLFDEKLLPLIAIYMGLSKGVSTLLIGKLDKTTVRVLNLLNKFLGVTYKTSKSEEHCLLTVIGCSYKNIFKPL